jgi:hypothetical protein
LYVDRTLFDLTTEERFALQHPSYRIGFSDPNGPAEAGRIKWDPKYLQGKPALDALISGLAANTAEVKLLPNDLRPPMSQQFTAGVRQLLGEFAIEAAYTGVRSKHTPTFYFANMNFTCTPRTFACFTENRIPGFGTILLLDDKGKTWYDALAVKVDRSYRKVDNFGWGAGLAYTLAKRQTEGFNDDFSFPNPADYPKQVRNDERHHIVANWILDVPYLYGIQFSGLTTLGTGTRYDRGDRFAPSGLLAGAGEPEKFSFILPHAFAYRVVDLRLRKDFFNLRQNRIGITVDAFNVFNFQNLGCYNSTADEKDANFGKANCVVSDPRRLQVGTEVNF